MGKQEIRNRLKRPVEVGDYVAIKDLVRYLRPASQIGASLRAKKKAQLIKSNQMMLVTELHKPQWSTAKMDIQGIQGTHSGKEFCNVDVIDYDIITDYFVEEVKNRKNSNKYGL